MSKFLSHDKMKARRSRHTFDPPGCTGFKAKPARYRVSIFLPRYGCFSSSHCKLSSIAKENVCINGLCYCSSGTTTTSSGWRQSNGFASLPCIHRGRQHTKVFSYRQVNLAADLLKTISKVINDLQMLLDETEVTKGMLATLETLYVKLIHQKV